MKQLSVFWTTCLTVLFLQLTVFKAIASPIDTYQFDNPVDQARYTDLTEVLRCPKCQNQNLAGSNSPIAQDLRRQIYEQIQAGKADKEIIDYMVYRYGEFVLYKPGFDSNTWLLWLSPVVFGLIGIFVITLIIRNQRRSKISALNQQQKAELDELLGKQNDQ